MKRPNNFSDVALILEKLEFALFKLERATDEYCKYVSSNQQSQAKTLLPEKKSRRRKQCKQYLDREEILSQVEITSMSIENFLMEVLIPRVPKDSPSRKESVVETLDIKGSTKSDTTIVK